MDVYTLVAAIIVVVVVVVVVVLLLRGRRRQSMAPSKEARGGGARSPEGGDLTVVGQATPAQASPGEVVQSTQPPVASSTVEWTSYAHAHGSSRTRSRRK
jgi:hypothetical protein